VTVNGVCHTLWQDDPQTHLCGRQSGHRSWHQCACGAVLDIPLIDQKRARREPAVPAPVTERIFDDGEGLRYSSHAAKRRAEMNVRHHEVRNALDHPETSYPADKRALGGTCYQAGRIVVITSADGLIVTLLWHRAEGRDERGQAIRT
jgi:hypothetical protein